MKAGPALITAVFLLQTASQTGAQIMGDTMEICTWAKELPTDQALGYKYRGELAGLDRSGAYDRVDSFLIDAQYGTNGWQQPQPPLPPEGMSVRIYGENAPPASIVWISPGLQNAWWIRMVVGSWNLIDTVKFFFPVLPSGYSYAAHDSFVVNFDQNTVGKFGCTTIPQYFGSVPLFKGTVISNGQDLTATFPLVLALSTTNPYRLAGVIAPREVLTADSLECFTCWHKIYGLELLSYRGLAKGGNVVLPWVRSVKIHPEPVVTGNLFDIQGRLLTNNQNAGGILVAGEQTQVGLGQLRE